MKKTVFFLIFILMALTSTVKAQMFSVGDDEGFRSNPFAPYLRAGIKTVDFSYQGVPDINNAGVFDLQGIAATFQFESGGFNLGFALGNKLTGLDDRNYFDLGINFTTPLRIAGNVNYMIGIPIKLGTQLTSVRNNQGGNEFAQTNISAGLGGLFMMHFPEKLGFSLQFIPSYGFSSSSGGFIGGSAFSMNGKARVNLYNLLFNKNVSLGYDYNFDSYDIDGEEYDYDLIGHSLTIGISF